MSSAVLSLDSLTCIYIASNSLSTFLFKSSNFAVVSTNASVLTVSIISSPNYPNLTLMSLALVSEN